MHQTFYSNLFWRGVHCEWAKRPVTMSIFQASYLISSLKPNYVPRSDLSEQLLFLLH